MVLWAPGYEMAGVAVGSNNRFEATTMAAEIDMSPKLKLIGVENVASFGNPVYATRKRSFHYFENKTGSLYKKN